jgi:hypothetical protein
MVPINMFFASFENYGDSIKLHFYLLTPFYSSQCDHQLLGTKFHDESPLGVIFKVKLTIMIICNFMCFVFPIQMS